MIIRVDKAGLILDVYAGEHDMAVPGYDIGTNIFDNVPSYITGKFSQAIEKVLSNNGMESFAYQSKSITAFAEYKIRILKSGVDEVIVIVDDNTQYAQSASQLLQTAELFDTIFHNLPVGVAFIAGPEFRFLRINQYLADLNGFPVEAHLGKRLVDVLPHAKKAIIPELIEVMNTGVPILNREFTIRLPNNSKPVYLIDWQIPILGDDEKPYAIISVVCNVTELKETSQRLLQSQKMESLGILSGGIAHDFNNILAIILGNAELLMTNRAKDNSERQNLEAILSAGNKAANLVKQILIFSQMDSIKLKPLELASLLHDALILARASIPTDIEIRKSIQKNSGTILADKTQIHQIVINLCTNAYHAIGDKGGLIEITLKRFESNDVPRIHFRESSQTIAIRNKPYLLLEIIDSGSGISIEDMKKIFDPFFTTKEVGKGTGLGLAVVHGIVKKHQGDIIVESEVGKGTVFKIFFPMIKVEKIKNDAATHRKKTILIVDDEPALVQLYQAILRRQEYTITVCSNGAEALELFTIDPNKFDIVLTDQAMPNMTGIQLSQALLAIRPDLPIILATGHSEFVTEEIALEMGIRKYLKKPLKIETLSQTIVDCLIY